MVLLVRSDEKASPRPLPPQGTKEDDDVRLPRGLKLCVILLSLILSILLVALDMTVIATTIPQITDEFQSLEQVGWYGSAYFLTCAAFQSVWGKAYTYFDTKATFTVGVAFFEIGTLICALSPNSTTFIVGRATTGIGGAALASGAFSIVAKIVTPKKRSMYIGFMGATFGKFKQFTVTSSLIVMIGIASVVGPLIGGFFTEYTKGSPYSGWRCCFWINVPIGILASLITVFFFHPPPSRYGSMCLREKILHMDLFGVAPLLTSMVLFLLAMRWGGTILPWSSGQVIGALAGSLICLLIFIMVEWSSGEKAMMQWRFFKKYAILLNLAYVFFLSGLYMPAVYFISIQFQALEGIHPAQAGLQLIPLVLCVSIGTIIANTSISKLGWPELWLLSGPILATSGALLVYKLGSGANVERWILFQIVLGFGVGFALQTPMSINQSLVKAEDIPAIVGITLFFEMSGASLLITSCDAAFSNRLVVSLKQSNSTIDSTSVIESGAGHLRTFFNSDDLDAVLNAYQDGLNATYLVMSICGCITVGISLLSILRTKTRQSLLSV